MIFTKPPFSHGFSMVFPWVFPMEIPWFSGRKTRRSASPISSAAWRASWAPIWMVPRGTWMCPCRGSSGSVHVVCLWCVCGDAKTKSFIGISWDFHGIFMGFQGISWKSIGISWDLPSGKDIKSYRGHRNSEWLINIAFENCHRTVDLPINSMVDLSSSIC